MKFHYKMKRTTRQYIVVAFICMVVIGGAATITSYIITNQIKSEYSTMLEAANNKIEANQRSVYVSLKEIKVGEEISKDVVEKIVAYSSQPQNSYIKEDEIGKLALIDIPAQTYIMSAMVTDSVIASELRETEYEVVYLSRNIVSSDTVDIRIDFPNGEDYIILTKKLIKSIADDNQSIYLWLSEEEILRMSSAIVDTYLYTGAKIYTTKYIEPNLQEESIVTYEPSLATLQLIQEDPNIVLTATNALSKMVRKAMENRLADSMNTDVQNIEWELSPNEKQESEIIAKESEIVEPESAIENNVTYMEEVREREAELDYGP